MKILNGRIYLCIDLKSFYASVECVERGLDPMTAKLVVADPERGDKTICLAVSPALKELGVRNRCRIFEIPKGIEYIAAPPRMQLYINYSADIYGVYLSFVSKDDIHVYSIDEAFLDVTDYLKMYGCGARELGQRIMNAVMEQTGIRAACGVGTNLYLAKIALDITAKHSPDFIGYLDEELYRRSLWEHKPLTDFWRIGRQMAKKLEKYGMTTMRSVAEANEDFLYRLFGIDAELLIDHAWGREPVTIADIKSYAPKTKSISSGQVLPCDYDFEKGKIIVKEMTELLCLELTDKKLITDSLTLHVGYSNSAKKPSARGSVTIERETNACTVLIPAVSGLYERIVDRNTPVRRINITCNRVSVYECEQFCFFDDAENAEKAGKIQEAVLGVKKRFGKNSILRGMNLQEGATSIERNRQIGGHKSGEQS